MTRRLTVVLSSLLALAACGAPDDTSLGEAPVDIPVHRDELSVAETALDRVVPLPVKVVRGEGFAGRDGALVRVVTGLLSCGFAETGRGEGRLSGGAFSVDVQREGTRFGSESVFVFVDEAGDGRCDDEAGDRVIRARIDSTTGTFTVDPATPAAASSWMCTLVNPLPSP
jgi:hypothetical protein